MKKRRSEESKESLSLRPENAIDMIKGVLRPLR